MKQYLTMLDHLLTHGKDRRDRTGVGTRGVFGYQMRFDLEKGFPLLTTKKVHMKSIIHELLWFLSGSGNIGYLQQHGVTIWDKWADANGDLGPVYGVQWRKWPAAKLIPGHPGNPDWIEDRIDLIQIDQIENLIHGLKTDPFGRRHIVSAWNPAEISQMKLPPCHTLWQCYVEQIHNPDCDSCYGTGIKNIPESVECHCISRKKLSLHLYARSIDSFLGLPFNIASYALLTSMLARVTGMSAGDLIISFGDLHLYKNHFEQAKEQLKREPKELPQLIIKRREKISDYTFDDLWVLGYDHHPAIKAPIAV